MDKWDILKLVLLLVIIVGFTIAGISSTFNVDNIKSEYVEYKCDVKNFRLSTTIEIEKDGKLVGEVKGNVLTLVTDPLTMYDPQGNKIAYAGDAYHFISQDSHGIYVNNTFTVEMVGKVELFSEEYEIYDGAEQLVATVDFNSHNTAGNMYDAQGDLVAVYTSSYGLKDFNVKVAKECQLDHYIVLMIMCSYYSDQAYDNS